MTACVDLVFRGDLPGYRYVEDDDWRTIAQLWRERAEKAESEVSDLGVKLQCCELDLRVQTERAEAAEANLRIRDARTEPPEVDCLVLSWAGGEWVASSYRTTEDDECYWSDEWSGLTHEIHEYPYWLPMPPPPEKS